MGKKMYVADKTVVKLREYLEDEDLCINRKEGYVELMDNLIEMERILVYKGEVESQAFINIIMESDKGLQLHEIVSFDYNYTDLGKNLIVEVVKIIDVKTDGGMLYISFLGKEITQKEMDEITEM